jgi:hypothetical protein
MPTKNHVLQIDKAIMIVLLLVGLYVSLFGAGAIPAVYAQEVRTETPSPEENESQAASLQEAINIAIENQRKSLADKHYYELISIVEIGEWGLGKAERIQKDSLEVIPADFSMILCQKEANGHWRVVLPNEVDSYLHLLNIFPESLLKNTTKEYIKEAYNASTQTIFSDHYLPWPKASAAFVYQNYSTHGEGQLDFGFSGNIRTTKAGTLFFAYDSHTWNKCTGQTNSWCNSNYPNAWYYNNAVVLKHAEGEYSSYLHLQTDSIPLEIINNCNNGNGGTCTAVNIPVGTVIGSVGNTGLSTVAHLHYGTGDYPYGRCNYPDVYDEDSDGNITETSICTGGIDGSHRISTNFYEKPYTASNCGTGVGQDPRLCMLYYPRNTNLISQNPDSVSNSFDDVSPTYWAWQYIERLYEAGITGGCSLGPLNYCPETTVTRAQMAVFLERGIHGWSYSPPAVGDSTGFGDVPVDYWSATWIKQLATEGITGGCGSGNYCPEHAVTRDQMAVFLLRSKYGSSYSPPAVGDSTGFGDVATDHWAAPWIKQLVTEGITAGCGSSNYCPELAVTRAQMAVFLVRTFNLP